MGVVLRQPRQALRGRPIALVGEIMMSEATGKFS
jgi:hypothetical protein